MFKILKDKFKSVIKSFSRKAEESLEEKPAEAETRKFEKELEQFVEKKEKEGVSEREEEPVMPEQVKQTSEKAEGLPEFEEAITETREELKGREEEIKAEERERERKRKESEERKGLLSRVSAVFRKKEGEESRGILKKVAEAITTTKLSMEKFDEMFWELEVVLLENNVAVEVIEKLKEDLKKTLVEKPIKRGEVEKTVKATLRQSIQELFVTDELTLAERVKEGKKPYVIMFVGINGSGKTTTIAKVARMLQQAGLKSVMAASDTFRAAAIQQLEEHAEKLGVKLIKHDYGADPAAVAFDAIKYAEAKKIDTVLIDTAGRLHSNVNLIEEMKKIERVAKPSLKVFVGEAITGNDCVEQARKFDEAIGIDAVVLAKADVDEKGGAAISVSYVTKKPIIYLGTGQGYNDLTPFNPAIVVESLGLEA